MNVPISVRIFSVITLLVNSLFLTADEVKILPLNGAESVIEHVVEDIQFDGTALLLTNRYAELANGLNYLDGGTWKTTDTTLEVEPGFAKAWKGPHKVAFSADINSGGSVAIELPDGGRLSSQIYGLAYVNTLTGEAVLIASVTNSQAWITETNRILYVNAFQEFAADVRYTYTRDGIEQDVILRESPPAPSEFGWNPADVRLEVWTEFATDQQPKVSRTDTNASGKSLTEGELENEAVDFGTMSMSPGRAFVSGQESETLTTVTRRWETVKGGQSFLVETVPLSTVALQLEALPEPAKRSGASLRKANQVKKFSDRVQAFRSMPRSVRRASTDQVLIPKIQSSEGLLALNSRPGVVLDYLLTLSTGQTDYTFRGDYTYHVTGNLNLSGVTTLEGGAVIKFSGTTPGLNVQGGFVLKTSRYRPAVFTAKDDDSVGEKISGSTGNPASTIYAEYALNFAAPPVTVRLENVRFRNAKYAVRFAGTLSHSLMNAQFIRCQFPISSSGSGTIGAYNILVDGSLSSGHVFSGAGTTVFIAENATIHNSPSLLTSCLLTARNCLLIGPGTFQSYTGQGVPSYSNYENQSPNGVFQTAIAGNFYLPPSSPHRNVGAAPTDPTLVAELKNLTADPPVVLSGTISADTTLSPTALVRKDTDTPDRGYHYAPADYIWSSMAVASATTLKFGRGVIALYCGAVGLQPSGNAKIISEGRPERLNLLTRCEAVQEQTKATGQADLTTSAALIDAPAPQISTRPEISFRFTELVGLGSNSRGAGLIATERLDHFAKVTIKDCLFRGGGLILDNPTFSPYNFAVEINIINNVFDRGYLNLVRYYYTTDIPATVSIYNNLFWNAGVTLMVSSSTGSNPYWILKDNQFDGGSISGYLGYSWCMVSHNGHLSTVSSPYGGTSSRSVLAMSYTSSPNGLGTWYQNTTDLENYGSRLATSAGLFNFSIRPAASASVDTPNDVANVDIGFHYVRTSPGGVIYDTDGDNMPDYLEDLNGNGATFQETGETRYDISNNLGSSGNVLIYSSKHSN